MFHLSNSCPFAYLPHFPRIDHCRGNCYKLLQATPQPLNLVAILSPPNNILWIFHACCDNMIFIFEIDAMPKKIFCIVPERIIHVIGYPRFCLAKAAGAASINTSGLRGGGLRCGGSSSPSGDHDSGGRA
jgi:hypothetical protein